MDNKKDWKELQAWEDKRKKENNEKFGMDFDNIDVMNQTKKVKQVSNFFNLSVKIGIIFFIIVCILVFCFALKFINYFFSKANADLNIIEQDYNIKTKLESKDVDKNGNGKYIFSLKDNKELKFIVIKRYGDIKDDFYDRSHKYYFEKWNDSDKERFEINEKIENELLEYETYIEIQGYDDIDNTLRLIYKFADFCNNNFSRSWNIYIRKGDFIGYFSDNYGLTKEENIKYMQDRYLKYQKNNN